MGRAIKPLVIAGLLCAAVAATVLVRWPQGSTAAGAGGVQTVAARREKFVLNLLVSGELAAVQAVKIVAPRIRNNSAAIKALAPEGTFVQPGDILVQIDNSNLVTGLNTEQINLEKAENELVRKQAEQEIQVKDLEVQLSQKKLELDKGALKAEIGRDLIALREWQDNQFQFEKAKKEYEKTDQTLQLARKASDEELALLRVRRDQTRARITRLESDMNQLQLRATRPGTVLYEIYPIMNGAPNERPRKFQVGDQVHSGMTVLSVPDLSRMEVRAFVSEVDGGSLRPGMRARVVVDAYPGESFGATVDYIPALAEKIRRNSNVRVFMVKLRLDQTDTVRMKPGMSARAEIFLDEREGLVLPRAAVRHEGQRVWVRHAQRGNVEVRLIGRNATTCLIEGLTEGDVVEIDR